MANILVVEDMDDIRLAYSMLLEMDGHNVDTASSAREAEKTLGEKIFDLVITDLIMPDGDGIELMNFMNSFESRPKAILVSGGGQKLSAPQALDLAKSLFDDVLSKPLTGDELKRAVNKVLQV